MKYLSLTFILLISLFISCKTETKKPANNDRAANLSPLPPSIITQLNNTCTAIDILPLRKEMNASLSFSKDQSQALQYIISFISDEKGALLGSCTPDGHIVFQENGEINYEADIYFSGGCSVFVWNKGGKISHVNKIKPEGIEFFKNFLKPISREKMESMSQPQ
ncbi:MAG: hypothetical protein HOP11_02240 [Saprospiraceae bacterium]|nr:hypothetical protein [Saprospiraceae bacterium]